MKDIKNTFYLPSQIVSGEIENFADIKDEIIKLIYIYKEKYPKTSLRSNKGGWQSDREGFFNLMFSKYLEIIKKEITELIREYKFVTDLDLSSMWININSKYSYNNRHTHPGASVSGVIWINIPENSGDFVFEMPDLFNYTLLSKTSNQHLIENNLLPAWAIKPKEGSMIIFPSYLPHYVDQNQNDEDRISISFNLILK